MQRFLILFLTLTVVVLSTCSMKSMLWNGLGMETPVPTKPFSSKGILIETNTSLSESCITSTNSIFHEAEVTPASPAKEPLILLSVLLVLTQPAISQQKKFYNNNSNSSGSGTVPIYLKLGQLIYYS